MEAGVSPITETDSNSSKELIRNSRVNATTSATFNEEFSRHIPKLFSSKIGEKPPPEANQKPGNP